MADLRINGWSDESLKCQPDLDQTIIRVDFGIRLLRELCDQALCPF